MAKAITGGHAPLGATIATEDVADKAKLHYFSTFGWHPLATEAALATCEYLSRHEAELFADVAARSIQFADALASMPWEREAKLRIRGLALAVDLGDRKHVEKLVERFREAGVLLGSEGSALVLFPALTIDEATAAEGLNLMEQALATRG